MNHRTASLLAALLLSAPWASAVAQPAPGAPPAPGAQPPPGAPDKPAQDAAPGDKPPVDTPQGDKPPAGAPPADKSPADKPKDDSPPSDKTSAGKPGDPGAAPAPPAPSAKPTDPDVANGSFAPAWLVGGSGTGPIPGRPFRVSSGGLTVWPLFLIQGQVTPYIGKGASLVAGDIAERPGFRLRRGRFGIGGEYRSILAMKLTTEVTANNEAVTLGLNEGWFGITPAAAFGAYIGVIGVPFSRSALAPTADTPLIDRPLTVRAMAPFNQLGAMVGGSVLSGKLQYWAGVYNGFQRSDLFYAGYDQGLVSLGNRFDNLAYAARIATSLLSSGAEIPAYRDMNDHLNIGASYFFSDGGARDIHSFEGDALFQMKGFRAMVEVLYSATAPEAVPTQPTIQIADIESFGVVAEAGYTFRKMLGGHLRFEWIDPNTAVDDASDAWLLTAGVSFAPPVVGDLVKTQLEFTHREEVFGSSIDNDSLTLQAQFVLQ